MKSKIRDNREKLLELNRKIFKEKEQYTEEELNKLKSEYEELKSKIKKEQEKETIKRFKTMKPFKTENDIPDVPVVSDDVYKNIIIPNLIRCGAIPKKDLIVGKTYIGDTRNAREATWDGEKFIYKRYKWGTYFDDDVKHFEDDDEYHNALFVPLKIKEDGNNHD